MFGKKPSPGLQKEIPVEDRVHLKPFLGIRPGVYLAGLYTLILLGILFFILLYPGISKPGSILVINSEPQGAAVRVDGITLGTTPCELFVQRGPRFIELVLPGFTPLRQEQAIPGRIFASLLFPRRIPISGTLEAPNPPDALISAAADYAHWSFTGEPTAAYQIPQDLSEGAYRIGPAAAVNPLMREELQEILKGAARFALTKAALRDLIRAQFFVSSGGLSPSPLTLIGTAGYILEYLSDIPGAAVWLAETLPPEGVRFVEGSPWYRQAVSIAADLSRILSEEAAKAKNAPSGEIIRLGNLNFRNIPAGEFIQAAPFPQRLRLESFYIANTELDKEDWERFLTAQPQWSRENSASLIKQGLASPGYLDEPLNPPYPYPGVPGISWFAAVAYCEWLTESLPSSLAAWEVRLPREAEWEYAASLFTAGNAPGDAAGGTAFPVNMLGGFWEWCADPYGFNSLPASRKVIDAISSPERSLRGGSWINPPGTVGITTRASLDPATSSPFVSFRPILAYRANTP